MKKSELVTTVANISGLSDAVVRDVLETAGDVVADLLAQPGDEAASVPGFGKFTARCGPIATWGMQPGGEVQRVEHPVKRYPMFVPAKSFRKMLAAKR